jgi:type IV pilus assembly protein PilB
MVGDPSRPSPPGAEPAGGGDATSTRRVLLGELLVESKVITPEQLGEVLSSPREAGKKLGQVLLERGWITEAQLTQTLSLQLSVPWVSLYHIDFSRQLLNRLSREVADKYCLIPIFVRHVKGQGETLYVAMDDPTNEGALAEVARLAGLPARPMIASASDIRSAIRVYYGEGTPAAPVIDVPPPPTRIDPPTTTREGRSSAGQASAREVAPVTPIAPTQPDPPRSYPPPPPPVRRSQPSVPPVATLGDEAPPPTTRSNPPTGPAGARASSTDEATAKPRRDESEPGRRRPRMVNLTLLDGTTIQLPAKKKKETVGEGLTARDFVSALRATAHGADASEILGDQVRWEPVIAALLSILLRKGLIADWEFVEELRKI